MANWQAEVQRIIRELSDGVSAALRAGNRRRVVVRGKDQKVLVQTSLSAVVLVALAVLVVAQVLAPLLIGGLIVGYALGYRVSILETKV